MKFDLGHIKKVAAVSVKLESEKTIFHYQILRLKRGEIHFEKGEKHIENVKDLIKKISNKTPIILHFNGKGILNRAVEKTENYRHQLLMNTALEDFYFSDYVGNDHVHASVIRRDAVDKVLAEIKEAVADVIMFTNGPYLAASMAEYIDKSSMTIDHVKLQLDHDLIVSEEKSQDNRQTTFVGEQQISHDMLGAVASAFHFFKASEKLVLAEHAELVEQGKAEAKQKNIFFRFAAAMVFFFLFLLTANYLYLDHLNDRIEQNYLTLAGFEEQMSEVNRLKEEKDRKEQLLDGSGLLSKYFLSYFLMDISHSVPQSVVLQKMIVHPLFDEVKSRHKIEFNENLVLIEGTSTSSFVLDSWIQKLKEKEWVASVDILDYTYKKNLGNFELELVIR